MGLSGCDPLVQSLVSCLLLWVLCRHNCSDPKLYCYRHLVPTQLCCNTGEPGLGLFALSFQLREELAGVWIPKCKFSRWLFLFSWSCLPLFLLGWCILFSSKNSMCNSLEAFSQAVSRNILIYTHVKVFPHQPWPVDLQSLFLLVKPQVTSKPLECLPPCAFFS